MTWAEAVVLWVGHLFNAHEAPGSLVYPCSLSTQEGQAGEQKFKVILGYTVS